MGYFTGTTWECFLKIMESGYLLTQPPKRVWKDFSEDYIYFVPFEENNEEEKGESLHYAAEQASFAVYELEGSRRVVLEIEDLEEELLEEDPDGKGIGALRYPFDIPVSKIKKVYIEKEDKRDKILELIAVTHYFRLKQEKKIKEYEFECLYDEDKEEIKWLFEKIGVKHLDKVEAHLLNDQTELENHYYDLMDEVEHQASFKEHEPTEWIETNIVA